MTTPKEFDYDLWRTPDGRYFVRVKESGEECEVDIETMRTLHNDAMRMYREQQGIPVYGVRNGKSIVLERTTLLSLSYVSTGEGLESNWAVDADSMETSYEVTSLEQEFKNCLTEKQRDIFEKCLIGGILPAEYARENHVSKAFVSKYISQIRERAKLFF